MPRWAAGAGAPTSGRAIRALALHRKNALFAGSDEGSRHSAVIASLIETCRLVGVEPHAYLTDVITRIVEGHPNHCLDDLLPGPTGHASPQSRGLTTPLTDELLPGANLATPTLRDVA